MTELMKRYESEKEQEGIMSDVHVLPTFSGKWRVAQWSNFKVSVYMTLFLIWYWSFHWFAPKHWWSD